MIRSCCSAVILLSLGRHRPRSKMSAPTSVFLPSGQACIWVLPSPSRTTNGFILCIGCICMGFRLRSVCYAQYIVVFMYIHIQYIGFPCHSTHVPATNIQIERLSLPPNRIASSIDGAKTKKPGGLLSHLRIVNHQAGDIEYSVILRCNLLFSLSAKPRRQSR